MKKQMLYACSLMVVVAGVAYSQDVAPAKPETLSNGSRAVTVTPGEKGGAAPSDAIISLDGKNLDQWVMAGDHSPLDGMLSMARWWSIRQWATSKPTLFKELSIASRV